MTDKEVEDIIRSNMNLQMNLAGIRADFEEKLQRTWVGLTDDEIQKCWKAAIKLNSEKGNDITNQTFYHLVKIVEEELMEKNYG